MTQVPPAKNRCLSCGFECAEAVGEVAVADLVKGYRIRFRIDVSPRFAGTERLLEIHCPRCDLRYFSPVITGDEAFYEALSRLDWYYMDEKSEFAIARRYIGARDRVLEVGAGRGAFARHCPGGYVGLEFNPVAVRQARKNGIGIDMELLESHARRHPGAYDVACAFQVLEHVAEPRAFVEQLAAVTRPGGQVIVSVPSEEGLPGRTLNDFLNLPPHHVTRWSDRALSSVCAGAGLSLKVIEHEPVADYHLGWYAALRLCRSLAPGLTGGPGHRLRLDTSGYLAWRALWLVGALSARLLRPLLRTAARAECGHTAVAIMQRR